MCVCVGISTRSLFQTRCGCVFCLRYHAIVVIFGERVGRRKGKEGINRDTPHLPFLVFQKPRKTTGKRTSNCFGFGGRGKDPVFLFFPWGFFFLLGLVSWLVDWSSKKGDTHLSSATSPFFPGIQIFLETPRTPTEMDPVFEKKDG